MSPEPKRRRAPAKPKQLDEPEAVQGEVVLSAAERASLGGQAGFKLGKPVMTPEGERARWEYIVALVRVGNYASVAAAAAGIDESGYYRYLKRGRDVATRLHELFGDDIEYDDKTTVVPLHKGTAVASENDWLCYRFCTAIQRAEAEAQAYAVGIVRSHMPDQWTAAMAFLERRDPKRWKRHQQHDVAAIVDEEAPDDDLLEAPEAVSDVLRRVADSQALPPGSDDPTG